MKKLLVFALVMGSVFSLDAAQREHRSRGRGFAENGHAAFQAAPAMHPPLVHYGHHGVPVPVVAVFRTQFVAVPYAVPVTVSQDFTTQKLFNCITTAAQSDIAVTQEIIGTWCTMAGSSHAPLYIEHLTGRTSLIVAIQNRRPDIALALYTYLTETLRSRFHVDEVNIRTIIHSPDTQTGNTILLATLKQIKMTHEKSPHEEARITDFVRFAHIIAKHSELDFRDPANPHALSVREYFTQHLSMQPICEPLLKYFPVDDTSPHGSQPDSAQGSTTPPIGENLAHAINRLNIATPGVDVIKPAASPQPLEFIATGEQSSAAVPSVEVAKTAKTAEEKAARNAAKKDRHALEKAQKLAADQQAAREVKEKEELQMVAGEQKAAQEALARTEKAKKENAAQTTRKELHKTAKRTPPAPTKVAAPVSSAQAAIVPNKVSTPARNSAQAFTPAKDTKSEKKAKDRAEAAAALAAKEQVLQAALTKNSPKAFSQALSAFDTDFKKLPTPLQRQTIDYMIAHPEELGASFQALHADNFLSLSKEQEQAAFKARLLNVDREALLKVIQQDNVALLEKYDLGISELEYHIGTMRLHYDKTPYYGAALIAIECGSPKVLKVLLRKITHFNVVISATLTHPEATKRYLLLQLLDRQIRRDITPLTLNDLLECIQIIVQNPTCDINAVDCKKKTALHLAAEMDNGAIIINYLLDQGASPFTIGSLNTPKLTGTALDFAITLDKADAALAILNHPRCLQFVLVEATKNISRTHKIYDFILEHTCLGTNPLILRAAQEEGINLVPLLIELSAWDQFDLLCGEEIDLAGTAEQLQGTRVLTQADLLAPKNYAFHYNSQNMIDGITINEPAYAHKFNALALAMQQFQIEKDKPEFVIAYEQSFNRGIFKLLQLVPVKQWVELFLYNAKVCDPILATASQSSPFYLLDECQETFKVIWDCYDHSFASEPDYRADAIADEVEAELARLAHTQSE